jgi:thymidylate synthase
MYISEPTIDDLLRTVLSRLLKSHNRIDASRGSMTELTGVLLELTNPRARLSRSETRGRLFSCLGELLWYLARTNKVAFISYYVPKYHEESDDGRSIFGGYGPRLFHMRRNNQVANIETLLKDKPTSRRAAIQLFDAGDLAGKHKDIPCTCTLQFMIRRERLYMITYMRSNDAFRGLPHDMFSFTMLQEIIARRLGVELGTYKHTVGSLHLYRPDRPTARDYLREGWQSTTSMPPMPTADPWSAIRRVLKAERAIRHGRKLSIGALRLPRYWADIVRLLQIYWYFNRHDEGGIEQLKARMSDSFFDPYIVGKTHAARHRRSEGG